MKAAPIPENEDERLEALRRYQILDTPPEQLFDDLVLLASQLLGVPTALISLIDVDRQWFKARVGLDAEQTPRDVSFCGHAVAAGETLVVQDATDDERFHDNPLVAGAPNLRFYAGAPITSPDGYHLGTLCAIDYQPRQFSEAQIKLLEALARQVTSQLELRRSIRLAEQQAETQKLFFNVALDLLCIVSFDGYFQTLNPAWTQILGWSEAELKSKPFIELVHPDDRQLTIEETSVLATGQHVTVGFENRWLCKDGTYRWLQWSATSDLERQIFIASARDITLMRRQARELEAARDAAEASNRSKSAFLANMSHELRTPLNSVIGFTNILIKNKKQNLLPNQLSFLERILANGKHLLSLLNDILDLSKIEAGHFTIETETVSLSELLDALRSHLEGLVTERGVGLRVTLPPHAKPIKADARRLKQVLINLVGNGAKFTSDGRIEIRVRTRKDGTVTRIDVSDSGIGIPADKLESIFEAFQQADNSTSRRFGGTGLGLTISRSLCIAMGFELDVASVEGEGTTFSIRVHPEAPPLQHHLPGQAQALESSEELVAPEHKPGRGKTLLVIDDDAESRAVITHYVEDLAVHVIAVDSGEQGLAIAKRHKPDLITLDLMMPGMDGFQVLRALREDAELCDIPVVVCSIVGSDHRGAIVDGHVDIVDKPVDPGLLAEVLNRRLSQSTEGGILLIVDDNADVRELLARSAREAGHEVHLAENGQVALELLEGGLRPHLILLDVRMPVMDGFGFLDALQSHHEFSALPIVICSASELNLEEVQRLKARTQDFLPKQEALAGQLGSLLQRFLA